jgi:hypothetical protein
MKIVSKVFAISFLALSFSLTSCSSTEEEVTPEEQQKTTNVSTSSLGNEALLNAIPAEIMAYFRGVVANDANAVAEAFSDNGEIIDVSRSIRGRENIARWTRNEVLGGRYLLLEQTVLANGDIRILLNFSPPPATSNGWRANYTFRIQNGKITLADLQYA